MSAAFSILSILAALFGVGVFKSTGPLTFIPKDHQQASLLHLEQTFYNTFDDPCFDSEMLKNENFELKYKFSQNQQDLNDFMKKEGFDSQLPSYCEILQNEVYSAARMRVSVEFKYKGQINKATQTATVPHALLHKLFDGSEIVEIWSPLYTSIFMKNENSALSGIKLFNSVRELQKRLLDDKTISSIATTLPTVKLQVQENTDFMTGFIISCHKSGHMPAHVLGKFIQKSTIILNQNGLLINQDQEPSKNHSPKQIQIFDQQEYVIKKPFVMWIVTGNGYGSEWIPGQHWYDKHHKTMPPLPIITCYIDNA